jgi:hypothetical protein
MTRLTMQRISGAAVILLSLIAPGCHKTRFPEPFYIVTRGVSQVVDSAGRVTMDAKCQDGEQLLGGAYLLPDNGVVRLTLLASYPVASDTWRVIVNRSDQPSAHSGYSDVVAAFAYCFTAPNYDLGLETVTAQNEGAGTPFFDIKANCPAGSTLTGGGYLTDTTGDSSALFNANVMGSSPMIDGDLNATGWQVGLAYVVNEMVPRTTVYARCSSRGLGHAKVVVAPLDLTKLGAAYDYRENEARCPINTFTTAGGYSLVGDALIPHPVFFSSSRDEYAAWRFETMYGYQTTTYKLRPCDPNLNPSCAVISAIAACIPIPDIPFVKVKITSPADKSNFGTETIDAQKNEFTQQITFTATASDEAGQPLGGPAVHWFRGGIEFGTGTSFTTALPSYGTISPITIKVTAFGKTTAASDQIQINVGTVK